MRGRGIIETLTITIGAILASLVLFGVFIVTYRRIFNGSWLSLTELYSLMYAGGFGSSFAWQSTLTRAAPLILTALCTALPARLGLVIIGGEGALVLGALATAAIGLHLPTATPLSSQVCMAVAGMIAGGLAMALVGALRHWRGVNATIASLLLTYIIIEVFKYAVEDPLRDPASLNKPSTFPIPEALWVGNMFGYDIHWGLAFGVVFCLLAYILMDHTGYGFAARMAGGNVRAAQAAGLPVGFLILSACFLGGAAAGLAGMVEIAAVHHQANASVIAYYGYTGILVSFIARHHPLGIIPAALLFGGLSASSGLLQRRLGLPDATIEVLKGIMFVLILLFETFYGRFRVFLPRTVLPEPAK